MDHKGITLVREKGKDIPELVITSALLHCGAMVSVAFASAEEGIPQISVMDQNLKEDDVVKHPQGALGYIKDLLEMTKDHKIVLHFSSVEKDAQPHTILCNEQKQPTLVAFLIGDFSEHKEADDHTNEWIEANEYLTPKILDVWERNDEDIPKLMQKLKEPMLSRDLSRMGQGDFLNCTILASNGDVCAFTGKASPPIRYDWGAASGDLDEHQTPAKETPKKEEEPKVDVKPLTQSEQLRAKLKAKSSGTETAPAPADKPGEKPALPPGQHVVSDPKPATGQPLNDLKAKILAKQAEGKPEEKPIGGDNLPDPLRIVQIGTFSKERLRQKWFAARGPSGRPEMDYPDWKTRIEPILVPTSKLKQVHQNMSLDEIAKRYPIAGDLDVKKFKMSSMPAKPATATSVPAVAAAQKANEEGLPIPTVHKATLREKIFSKPKIVALTDRKGQNVLNPEFLPQMEDKHPAFWEAMGLPNVNSMDWWKRDTYKEIGSFSLDGLADCAFGEKMLRCKQEAVIIALQARIAELTGEPLPGTSTQPDVTETKPQTQAEKLKAKLKQQRVA